MKIDIVSIFGSLLLVSYVHCARSRLEETVIDRTEVQPNGLRFQRILQRKKRFLLFPPGSAIVVSAIHFYSDIVNLFRY